MRAQNAASKSPSSSSLPPAAAAASPKSTPSGRGRGRGRGGRGRGRGRSGSPAVAAAMEAAHESKVSEMVETPEVTLQQKEDESVTSVVEEVREQEKAVEVDKKVGAPVSDEGKDVEEEEDQEPVEEVFEEPVAEDGKGSREGEVAVEKEVEEEGAQVEEDEQKEISDMAEKRMLKKEQEIFIGGLDRDVVEEDIKEVFEQVGEVVDVRLHKDFATNKNKGFAFVRFASKEQADRALVEVKNPMIRGKRCGVVPSEDNDTLFLGNICNTWTKEAVRRRLQDYGIDGVVNITLVPDTQNEGLSRGFAFLEFSCHAEAMLAFKRLQKPDVIFGHAERTAKVAFAEPLREADPELMAQVKSVFIDGLPPYWDEDRVKEQFKGYGEIERVVLARNMSSAKRNDFGFVNFTTHESAVACIEGTNNTDLGDDGKSKIKARARLANPLPKTQAVKGEMTGGFCIGYSGVGSNRFGRGTGRGRFSSSRAGFRGGRGSHMYGHGRSGRPQFAADNSIEASPSDFHSTGPFGFRGGRLPSASGRDAAYVGGHGRGFPSRRPLLPPEGNDAFDSGHGRGFPSRRPLLPPEGNIAFDGGHGGGFPSRRPLLPPEGNIAFDSGHGRGFPSRRPLPPEGNFAFESGHERGFPSRRPLLPPEGNGAFDSGHGRGFPSRRPLIPPVRDYDRPFGEDPYFYQEMDHGLKRPYSMMEQDPEYFQPGPRLRARLDYHDPHAGGSRSRDSFVMGGPYSRDFHSADHGGRVHSSFYRGEQSGGGYYY